MQSMIHSMNVMLEYILSTFYYMQSMNMSWMNMFNVQCMWVCVCNICLYVCNVCVQCASLAAGAAEAVRVLRALLAAAALASKTGQHKLLTGCFKVPVSGDSTDGQHSIACQWRYHRVVSRLALKEFPLTSGMCPSLESTTTNDHSARQWRYGRWNR